MYGELTDKETVARLEYTLENQQQDQFEILLYKKNSKYCTLYHNKTKINIWPPPLSSNFETTRICIYTM